MTGVPTTDVAGRPQPSRRVKIQKNLVVIIFASVALLFLKLLQYGYLEDVDRKVVIATTIWLFWALLKVYQRLMTWLAPITDVASTNTTADAKKTDTKKGAARRAKKAD